MKTDAERQHAYQERQRRAGLVRLHCWATPDTREALRDIAEREGVTVGEVLELAMLLARRHFRTTQTTTSTRPRPVIAAQSAKPASAPQSAFAPTSNTNASPTPAEPPESPSSSPEPPDDSDARIRAAAADAYRLEP